MYKIKITVERVNSARFGTYYAATARNVNGGYICCDVRGKTEAEARRLCRGKAARYMGEG